MRKVGEILLSLDKDALFEEIVKRFQLKDNFEAYIKWLDKCYKLSKRPKRNNGIIILETMKDEETDDVCVIPFFTFKKYLNHDDLSMPKEEQKGV